MRRVVLYGAASAVWPLWGVVANVADHNLIAAAWALLCAGWAVAFWVLAGRRP